MSTYNCELPITEHSELIEAVCNRIAESSLYSNRWHTHYTRVDLYPDSNGIDVDSPIYESLWYLIRRYYANKYNEADSAYWSIRRESNDTSKIDSARQEMQSKEALYGKVTDVNRDHFHSAIGSELVNKQGKFAKRFIRHFKDMTGENLPNEIISQIGNLITEGLNKEASTHYVDVTNDFNWDDGDFGHSGSCWFDSDQYPTSLDSLLNVNGYCLRKFDERGYDEGRLWFIPSVLDGQEVFITFNAYGYDGENREASKILAQLLQEVSGIKYICTSIDFESSYSSSAMYINPGQMIVYPDTMRIDRDSEFTMRIRKIEGDHYDRIVENDDSYYCERCNERLSEDEVYSDDSGFYCESCYDDLYTRCNHCGDTLARDTSEVYTSESGYDFCESCYTDKYAFCESCESEVENDDLVIIDGQGYCESCADDRTVKCHNCDQRVDSDEIKTFEGQYYCEACIDEVSFTCPSCGETHSIDDLPHDESCVKWSYYDSTFVYDSKRDDSNPDRLCAKCLDGQPVITSNQLPLFDRDSYPQLFETTLLYAILEA